MGVEVKSGGEGVIVADRGCNEGCCCNGRNSGWGSGWGAVGGALVGGGFGAAAVSVWDKINDTKADIQKWNLLFRKQKLVFTKTYLMLLVELLLKLQEFLDK